MNVFQRFVKCSGLVPLSVTLVATLSAALPAAAQSEPKAEVSVGYVILRDHDVYGETFPLGWNADVAVSLSESLRILGETGGAYKKLNLLGTAFDLSVHTLMAGARLSFWQRGRTAWSVQFLAGVARVGASVFSESASTKMFALQPGAEVDVRITDLLGVRIGGDYRRIQAEGPELRFVAGAVFWVGKK